MMKMKNIAKTACTLAMMAVASFAHADDTPLVQAMKMRDKQNEIMLAIQKRGIECTSINDAPRAIMNISYINEFLDGAYEGPIVIGKANFTASPFVNVTGKFNLILSNMTSIAAS